MNVKYRLNHFLRSHRGRQEAEMAKVGRQLAARAARLDEEGRREMARRTSDVRGALRRGALHLTLSEVRALAADTREREANLALDREVEREVGAVEAVAAYHGLSGDEYMASVPRLGAIEITWFGKDEEEEEVFDLSYDTTEPE